MGSCLSNGNAAGNSSGNGAGNTARNTTRNGSGNGVGKSAKKDARNTTREGPVKLECPSCGYTNNRHGNECPASNRIPETPSEGG